MILINLPQIPDILFYPSFSSTSTLDDADEMAIEDILSPDKNRPATSSSSWPSLLSGEESTSTVPSVDGYASDCDSEGSQTVSARRPAHRTKPHHHHSLGLNLALAFALQRKRAMRAVRRLARLASLPLPAVISFHTFGEHLYVYPDRAYPSSETRPPRGQRQPLGAPHPSADAESDGDSAAAASLVSGPAALDLSAAVKGPFSSHRMIAYR